MQILTYLVLTLSSALQFVLPFSGNGISIPVTNNINLRYAEADLGSNQVSLADLNLQGNGVTVQQNQTKDLVMTTRTGQASSIFLKEQLKTSEDQPGFSTYFVMNVYRLNPGPADGYVFVIAANSNSLGQSGGGLGYAGINNSVGIEFDFYNNGGENIASSEIFTNGQTFASAGSVFDPNYINQWNTKSAGQLVRAFHTWIEYDHTNTRLELRVALADVESAPTPARPVNPLISRVTNLTQISDFFYAGFTAATGGLAQQMAVKSWYLSNRYIEGGIDPNSENNIVDNEAPSAPTFDVEETSGAYRLSIGGSIDDQSSVVGYQWQFNNQTWTAYQETFSTSNIGHYKARAFDEAGNFSSVTNLYIYQIRFFINNLEYTSVLRTSLEDDYPINQSFDINGYTYSQWFDNPQFSGQPLQTLSPQSQSITLYGKPTANIYSITYELNEGMFDQIAPSNFATGETVVIPNPSRVGYSFEGWFYDESFTLPLDGLSLPFSSINLYAKWRVNQYTLQFETMGGSLINAVTLPYEGAINLTNHPSREGYAFVGWYRDEALLQPFESTTMPAENLILYAKWTLNIYGIEFVLNGGTFEPTVDEYTIETQTIQLPEPTRVGHTFAGWYNNPSFTGSLISAIETGSFGDVELYAKWIINQYQIHFQTNFALDMDSLTYNYGTILPLLPTPTRLGYTFAGWHEDDALTNAMSILTMPAFDFTLYAKWSVNIYDITLHLNQGTASQLPTTYTIESSEIILPEPQREGYTFLGWFENAELNGSTIMTIPTGRTGDIELFAGWMINQYHITFIGDGYQESITSDYQSNITLPMISDDLKPGYTFLGWSYQGTFYDETFSVPSENVTLTAIYEGNTTIISFFVPEGTITIESTSGETISNLPTLILPEQYRFLGWSLVPLDATQIIDSQFVVPNSETLNLYPIWVMNDTPNVMNPTIQPSHQTQTSIFTEFLSFILTISFGLVFFITATIKNGKRYDKSI